MTTDAEVDVYMAEHLKSGPHKRCIVCRLWERLAQR